MADDDIPEGAVVMEYVGVVKLKPERKHSYKHRVSGDGSGGGGIVKAEEAPVDSEMQVMGEDGATGEQEEASGRGEGESAGEMEEESVGEKEERQIRNRSAFAKSPPSSPSSKDKGVREGNGMEEEIHGEDEEGEEGRGARMTEEEIIAELKGKVCRVFLCLWSSVSFC